MDIGQISSTFTTSAASVYTQASNFVASNYQKVSNFAVPYINVAFQAVSSFFNTSFSWVSANVKPVLATVAITTIVGALIGAGIQRWKTAAV